MNDTTMKATGPVRSAEGTVTIWYGMFYLENQDLAGDEDSEGSEEELETPDDETWVTVGSDCLAAASAINDHKARVRLELWANEPPRQTTLWEKSTDVQLLFHAGTIGTVVVTGGPEGTARLKLPDGPLHVRAYYRGRDDVIAAVQATHARMNTSAADEPVDWPVGVEEFLFQFWPPLRRHIRLDP